MATAGRVDRNIQTACAPRNALAHQTRPVAVNTSRKCTRPNPFKQSWKPISRLDPLAGRVVSRTQTTSYLRVIIDSTRILRLRGAKILVRDSTTHGQQSRIKAVSDHHLHSSLMRNHDIWLIGRIDCKCGNIDPSTISQELPSQVYCKSPCPGDRTETCGAAGHYAEAYNLLAKTTTPPSPTKPSTPASASATTSATPSSVGTSSSSSASNIGCFADGKAMGGTTYTSKFMTVDVCLYYCKYANYTYVGLSNGSERDKSLGVTAGFSIDMMV